MLFSQIFVLLHGVPCVLKMLYFEDCGVVSFLVSFFVNPQFFRNIVPLLDLMNHDLVDSNVDYDYDDGWWIIRATKDIPKNTQLFVSYGICFLLLLSLFLLSLSRRHDHHHFKGCKSRLEVLINYGYTPRSTLEECDCINVKGNVLQTISNNLVWNKQLVIPVNLDDELKLVLDGHKRLSNNTEIALLQKETIKYIEKCLRIFELMKKKAANNKDEL